ncbi:MAG: tRNA (adenosine(37)-N6)-threonylcarbamoyltransferase complex ATPase subunit type 1 TsaE [Eubacteriales bacterium]
MTYKTTTPEQTEQLGSALAKALHAGDILAYTGDLGAGKTAMTRGIAHGIGYTESVTSPTFTLVHEYLGGSLPLFHFDLYRLDHEDQLFDIGFDDYLARKGVCIIEWSEKAPQTLSTEQVIWIDIAVTDVQRTITITPPPERDLDLSQ